MRAPFGMVRRSRATGRRVDPEAGEAEGPGARHERHGNVEGWVGWSHPRIGCQLLVSDGDVDEPVDEPVEELGGVTEPGARPGVGGVGATVITSAFNDAMPV